MADKVETAEHYLKRPFEPMGPPVRMIPLDDKGRQVLGVSAGGFHITVAKPSEGPDELVIAMIVGEAAVFVALPRYLAFDVAEAMRKSAESMALPKAEPEVEARRG